MTRPADEQRGLCRPFVSPDPQKFRASALHCSELWGIGGAHFNHFRPLQHCFATGLATAAVTSKLLAMELAFDKSSKHIWTFDKPSKHICKFEIQLAYIREERLFFFSKQ